ncbi:amidohydrolase family protein [Trujillonella humicola]|uniref:amidohydrolase family protein n=1 Tax=Trujillonella humicola TaxID=3383699 RepID=UPI003905C74B
MIDDYFVINPVAHAYNLEPANIRNKPGQLLCDMLWGLHQTWSPPHAQMTHEEFTSDWTVDALAQALFVEADVDIASTHTLRLDSYFHDGLAAREKTVEAATRYPDRFLAYVGVDPTAGLETCLRDLDEQMADLPQAVGLKMYPAQVEPDRSWRMDDPDLAFPIIERAIEHGLKTVAIHKAAPLGPVPMNPYRVDDVDGAAGRFPEMNFEIIHAGLAFTRETSLALARFANVYANLEVTSLLLLKAPQMFEEVMAEFMLWGGPDKIIFSDGTMFAHTQPFLEAFVDFQFSERTCNGMGVEPLTREDKAKILGGNYARLVGLDIDAARARIEGDEFAVARASADRPAPYAAWKREFAADQVGLRR